MSYLPKFILLFFLTFVSGCQITDDLGKNKKSISHSKVLTSEKKSKVCHYNSSGGSYPGLKYCSNEVILRDGCDTQSFYFDKRLVAEVQRRGLTCAASPKNSVAANVKPKTKSLQAPISKVSIDCRQATPQYCTMDQICTHATFYKNGKLVWKSQAIWQVQVAKKRKLTCGITENGVPLSAASAINKNDKNINSRNAAIEKLKAEKQELEEILSETQEIINQQNEIRNSAYKSCLGQCLVNNRAGRGFSNGLNGLAQCNTSCSPLKYGGEVVPPSWERNLRRLEVINCQITQMSRNQAIAHCSKF